jgi:hypothetical protein
MTAYDPALLIVRHGPVQVEDVTVHDDGSIETVTTRPISVFNYTPAGLVELHGDEKAHALRAWQIDLSEGWEDQC